MSNPITIRPERPEDIEAIARVTREAFQGQPYSSLTEHFIIAALRNSNALAVSLVAESDGKVVAHIAFSPVEISDGSQGWYGLGPVAVEPQRQREGIGSALVRAGLEALRKLGAHGCVLVGAPELYRRFGFENDPGLTFEGAPQEYFLALHFDSGPGQKPQGRVRYHEAFQAAGDPLE